MTKEEYLEYWKSMSHDELMVRARLYIDRIAAQAAEIEQLKSENAYLRYFHSYADFGPADDDVRRSIDTAYVAAGNTIPDGWRDDEDEM